VKYAEFLTRRHFDARELLALGHGTLLDDAPAGFRGRLPIPPMLMLDRVVELHRDGARGRAVAEQDVRLDAWFFQCHFLGDPVQPGCLGLDGIWQLVGFFCVWSGGLGQGRALGVGDVEFTGEITPDTRLVRYEVDVLRSTRLRSGGVITVADARVLADGVPIYAMKRVRSGTFPTERSARYPWPANASRAEGEGA
jgi:3-hydroxyacyl-[acyl-carrier protein] dehydratase/trans-2-decenoyl-[acyl-carrier protein] isomerase